MLVKLKDIPSMVETQVKNDIGLDVNIKSNILKYKFQNQFILIIENIDQKLIDYLGVKSRGDLTKALLEKTFPQIKNIEDLININDKSIRKGEIKLNVK